MLMITAILAGCSQLPWATREPDIRPALPPKEPFPLVVAEAVERLELLGFACSFSPASDLSAAWHCQAARGANGESLALTMIGDEDGPIEDAAAILIMEGEPAVLDQTAAVAFRDLVIEGLLPGEGRPSLDEVHAVVADNFQMSAGDGWILVFHRNMSSRTMLIQYTTAED